MKQNMLRRTTSIVSVAVENAEVKDNGLVIATSTEPVELKFEVQSTGNFMKIVYNFLDMKGNSELVIIVEGEGSEREEHKLGNFFGTSIPFYLKANFKVKLITFQISAAEEIQIRQLELISISEVEYKFNKIKQYSIKLNKLISKQPHLRRKFFEELKSNGLKHTLRKTKQKLYNSNNNYNNIHVLPPVRTQKVGQTSVSPILFICHEAQNAGASILSLNLVKTMKEMFKKEIIVILLKGGPLEKDFSEYATVISLNQNSLSYLENENEVKKVVVGLKEQNVKFCIANSVVSNIMAKILSEHGIKVISLIHELPTSIITYNFNEAAQFVCQYSDKVVFPNQFVKKAFEKHFSLNEDKIMIRPQGIYKKRMGSLNKEQSKKELCNSLGISTNSKIILGGGYGDIRKGIDLFFALTKEIVLEEEKRDYHFVWAGQLDSVLEKWMVHDAEVLGLMPNIHLMGFQSNMLPILQGADVFILPSREDPFPSIALEAIDNGTPVVTFDSNGGMPEFIRKIGMIPSSYLNVSEMKNEIFRILNHPVLYDQVVQEGLELVEKDLNFSEYVADLLSLSSPGKNQKSSVSVIIPNYNYEAYLPERLMSIVNQTVQPHEIIFLDDVSKDESVKVAQAFLQKHKIPFKIIRNEKNNGCFGQWIKGINLAEGEYVWIAEADDFCEIDFLEKLTPLFEDDEVNLAYCQSEIIDGQSRKVGFNYESYTKDLSETKWSSSYSVEGRHEVVQALGIKNTIPNASAVIFRKAALAGIENELKDYKIGGDWLAYLYVLRIGKIAFLSETLNYHRRHSSSIVSRSEQSLGFYNELINIKRFVIENFQIPKSQMHAFLNLVPNEYARLGCKGYESNNIMDNDKLAGAFESLVNDCRHSMDKYNYLNSRKKILFVAPDFEVGGGQMLVVRLANFFSAYQEVYIYNARPWLVDRVITTMISESVTILPSNGDPNELGAYMDSIGIEVVNSHIWWSDKITYRAIKNKPLTQWVLSMHGCYEALMKNPDWDIDFEGLVKPVLDRANHIIYATDKNLEIFSEVKINTPSKRRKIYYGYQLQNIPKKNKQDLGIEENSFVFGLVSRAIKEKGWEESIKAIIELNKNYDNKAHLILVGNGAYAEQIKKAYEKYSFIHVVCNLTKPSEWIGWVKVFDVALLPSYFISESLPNSIIEYLAYNKPVISTNLGEIKTMLYAENTNKYAGIILELNNERKVEVDELTNAMSTLMSDTKKFHELKENTSFLFQQFSMESFASSYFELF